MPAATPLFHRLPLAAAIALTLPLPALAATPKPTELDRVQVKVSTATRSERLLSDVPIRTEVLRKEDIALRAATDFSRAAELINGLRVESNCQNCNTSEVQLLGLPGAYNQLLFDGIPLLSTLGSVYGLEQIPAGFVDRIEVVKGGGSALYGPGAVAGVINLIPPLPARSGGHVQAGVDVLKGTPQKNADVRLDLVAKEADAGLSVIAQRNWNSGIDYNGDGYTEITRKNLKVGGLQAWYAPTPGTRLRLDLQVTDETRRGGNRLDQPEYLANIAESLDTKYRRGSVSWDQEINADVDFRLAYAFADIDRDSFYGGLGDVVTDPSAPGYDPSQLDPNVAGSAASRSWRQYGRTHNPLHYIDSQLNWRLGAHALAFGVQYKHEALRDDNRTGDGQRLAVLEDATFHNLGAFIQDEWSLRDNVDLVLGARVDKSSELDSAVFSPRIALAWQATPNLKWRAGIATGFRAPEIFVEDVHVDTLGGEQVRVRNTDGLKEERALTTLFGFDWRSDPANPVWSWDATASYARIRDTFALGEIQRGDDGQLSQLRYNASGSNVLGAETNLGWQPSPQWRLTAGASWYRSRFREPQRIFDDTGDGGDTVIESRDYLKTPRWTGLAQLSWMPAEPWETFVALRHTGPMAVLNNRLGELHRTRSFLVTDLGARWHRHLGAQAQQEVSVAAGVKNVFDQRQKDLEMGALRDSDYVYGPRFARSWYVNLRYAF
ncbi:TonB-dependent receptor [Stenotrophomonas maltophilia]|uniref:TonB-dependent receptor plug domain-containing protein n=1 Tax=Stenotrophomonas maltophilia TaxID=40324 RepID=UPI000E27446F|nr:TonB-dependent receptor [Stenotrophomonas maltophilia]REC85289.1 TonB-dependent receptor [Stenotrophomonas maltophilia]